MIEEPPLLTIRRPARRPSDAQIAAFEGVPSSVVSDAMDGRGALSSVVRRLATSDGPASVVGPALTAGCGPADLLALLGALGFIQTGDVVVASFDAHQGCALFGDRLAGMMKNAGAVAAVTDGPVRDQAGIRDVALPVWCSGVTPASPYAKGPGTIGQPVQLAGQRVETGDLVIADADGVVIVPFAEIDAVAARAAEIIALETALDARIRDENLHLPEDIADLLESDKVRYID